MRIVVLGAGGGVGQLAVSLAHATDDEVVAAGRTEPDAPPGVERRAVDVRDATAVADVLVGADAVLWCVGVTRRSGPDVGRVGMQNVVTASHQVGLQRLVSVSGAGVTLPGDDKGPGARFVSALTRRFARDLVEDKAGEHDVLAGSGLVWTEVRPPRLTDGPPSTAWELTDRAPGLRAGAVPRADVATAMLELARSERWARSSPFLVRRAG